MFAQVVGGTHGNEATGVALATHYLRYVHMHSAVQCAAAFAPSRWVGSFETICIPRSLYRNPVSVQRPSFETSIVIGNPAAVKANRRYVDKDLNRYVHVCENNNRRKAPKQGQVWCSTAELLTMRRGVRTVPDAF
jgi:succinylglutamate desuccinylase